MITEDYVSYEIARLLRDKGFDIETEQSYDKNGKFDCQILVVSNEKRLPHVSAPTLQMAMKWLREVHHLHIIPEISDSSQLNPKYYIVVWDTTPKRESYILELFDSYEEACKEGIKYCLENLI